MAVAFAGYRAFLARALEGIFWTALALGLLLALLLAFIGDISGEITLDLSVDAGDGAWLVLLLPVLGLLLASLLSPLSWALRAGWHTLRRRLGGSGESP